MLAVRTPGAPRTTRTGAVRDSAFPFERQGRLLRSRSISGLYSRSLHSGLQPPCLRFATPVTGRHARLGSRLLARLCRGRHLRRQTSTRLQGATPTPPCVRVRTGRFGRLCGFHGRRAFGGGVRRTGFGPCPETVAGFTRSHFREGQLELDFPPHGQCENSVLLVLPTVRAFTSGQARRLLCPLLTSAP